MDGSQIWSENEGFILVEDMDSNHIEEPFDSPTFKRIQVWSEGDTKKLLDLYATYLPEIGPLRKFRTKKDMWARIAKEIDGKTLKQCEERYKTVLRRKKLAVENNRASGSKRKSVDFDEELNKICLLDDSIEPEILISSHKCIKIEKSANKIKSEKPTKTNKTVQETLFELHEKKEEARERRHKEKMELLKQLLAPRDA